MLVWLDLLILIKYLFVIFYLLCYMLQIILKYIQGFKNSMIRWRDLSLLVF